MPYKFIFDLSKIPRFFFTEIAKIGYQGAVHKRVGRTLQRVIKKFKIQEATGLNLSDTITLLQDLIDMQAVNLIERERFVKTERRALFLPHCSRKYMDNQCKASFDPTVPTYVCAHCSNDCPVGEAVLFAEKKEYDVYIVPGGSCIPKILKSKNYDGIVGVACGEEVKAGMGLLESMGICGQSVPLIKNGCANTAFNHETLSKTLLTSR
jgi:hypothetical protein